MDRLPTSTRFAASKTLVGLGFGGGFLVWGIFVVLLFCGAFL